jgi:NitT/TauT family transport system substrate-binding protein
MTTEIHEGGHMNSIRWILLLSLALLLTACSIGDDNQDSPQQDLELVRLVMGFRPDVQFAPLYVAVENGHYSDAGFEVSFEHMPENQALSLVGAGELSFVIASGEQVLLARAQGLPVVYVMAWWQDYPVAVAIPKDAGVQSPQDLAGMRIGIPGLYGASYIGFRALLSEAGMQEEEVQLDAIEYTQVESLMAGREDAVVIYANNEPLQLEKLGMPVDLLKVADYVHLASNGLVTNETLLREDPDLVARFVEATLLGLQDTLNDPTAAFEISKRYVDGLAGMDEEDQALILKVLKSSLPFWSAERLGYSNPAAWENMQDVLIDMDLLEGPLDLDQAYRNDFLP